MSRLFFSPLPSRPPPQTHVGPIVSDEEEKRRPPGEIFFLIRISCRPKVSCREEGGRGQSKSCGLKGKTDIIGSSSGILISAAEGKKASPYKGRGKEEMETFKKV